jgi:hypothetical protein
MGISDGERARFIIARIEEGGTKSVGMIVPDLRPADCDTHSFRAVVVDRAPVTPRADLVLVIVDVVAFIRVIHVRAVARRLIFIKQAVIDEVIGEERPHPSRVAGAIVQKRATGDVSRFYAEKVQRAAARVRPEQLGLVVGEGHIDGAQYAVAQAFVCATPLQQYPALPEAKPQVHVEVTCPCEHADEPEQSFAQVVVLSLSSHLPSPHFSSAQAVWKTASTSIATIIIRIRLSLWTVTPSQSV